MYFSLMSFFFFFNNIVNICIILHDFIIFSNFIIQLPSHHDEQKYLIYLIYGKVCKLSSRIFVGNYNNIIIYNIYLIYK